MDIQSTVFGIVFGALAYAVFVPDSEPVSKEETFSHYAVTKPAVKQSHSGICHDEGSKWYEKTKHYVAYNDIVECLDNGGRLPKGYKSGNPFLKFKDPNYQPTTSN